MLQLLPIAYLLLVSPSLCYWDLKEHRLPNRFTFSAIAVSFMAVALSGDWVKIATAVSIGSMTLLVGMLLNHFGALGMGDVKLLVAIAIMLAYFEPIYYLYALGLGLFVATAVSLYLLLIKKLRRDSAIALGPFLLFGFAFLAVVVLRDFITVGV